jgi:hypothetical protein
VVATYESIKDLCPKKPRTYRKKARKDYLAIAKQRRPTQGTKRTAIKKQLQYLKRNLAHIEKLIKLGSPLDNLSKQQYKLLHFLKDYEYRFVCIKNIKLPKKKTRFDPTPHFFRESSIQILKRDGLYFQFNDLSQCKR